MNRMCIKLLINSFIVIILCFVCCLQIGCNDTQSNAPGIDTPAQIPSTAQPDRFGVFDYLNNQNYHGAVLVFEQGEEIISGGFGYANAENGKINDSEVSFRIGSLSKQFTSMAIFILQERGLLSIDKTVADYIFDYPNGDKITLHHLLTHTSGIPNYTEFDFYPSIVENEHTLEQVLDYFKDEPLDFTPGSQFSYSNSGYVLLGAIIESVSDLSYSEFLHDEIFAPLDMAQSGYLNLQENGIQVAQGYLSDYQLSPFLHPTIPSADGGLASSVSDLYKWHRALQDNILINEDTKLLMFSANLDNAAAGWFVANYFDTLMYFHGGGYSGFRAGIYHYPVQNRLIVLLSNSENTDINKLARRIDELIREQ